jgi:predicted nucleic acid-binding protein
MTGDTVVEASYRAFFNDPDIRMLPMTAAICERAARIRATHKLELVDSLHLATAAEYACGLFLTNDGQLARCTDIAVEVLK